MTPLTIRTARLELVAVDVAAARAAAGGAAQLGALLGATVPPGWPDPLLAEGFEATVQMHEADPTLAGWGFWNAVTRDDRVLIGGAGYKGHPDPDGRVDIGYAVVESHRCRGYATEMVEALLARAFDDARVTRVVGETFAELVPSIRVMEKCGFLFAGIATGHEGEAGVSQYALTRESYLARRAGKAR